MWLCVRVLPRPCRVLGYIQTGVPGEDRTSQICKRVIWNAVKCGSLCSVRFRYTHATWVSSYRKQRGLELRLWNYRPAGMSAFTSRPVISVLCRRGGAHLPRNTCKCKCGTCATRVKVRRARCECWPFGFMCAGAGSNMLTHWPGSPVDQAHTPSAPIGC